MKSFKAGNQINQGTYKSVSPVIYLLLIILLNFNNLISNKLLNKQL